MESRFVALPPQTNDLIGLNTIKPSEFKEYLPSQTCNWINPTEIGSLELRIETSCSIFKTVSSTKSRIYAALAKARRRNLSAVPCRMLVRSFGVTGFFSMWSGATKSIRSCKFAWSHPVTSMVSIAGKSRRTVSRSSNPSSSPSRAKSRISASAPFRRSNVRASVTLLAEPTTSHCAARQISSSKKHKIGSSSTIATFTATMTGSLSEKWSSTLSHTYLNQRRLCFGKNT